MDTKLHEAVRYGDSESVFDALKNGFDPNVLGLLKWTPVQEAARAGERDILFHLLQHGGNPNLHDGLCSQNTALHFAAAEGHLDCLRLLLQHGGNATLLNAARKTCLQVAPLEYRDTVSKLIAEFGGEKKTAEQNNHNANMNQQRAITDIVDKWNTLPEVPTRAEMGYLHLSFEYHKGALKVRVWQISDLLLPPPQISMIHSIFVRTYFIPDKARKSHRRTEDIVIDMPEFSGVETPKTGIQHIFTPSSFKFRTPLLYRAVTEDVIKERSLQLEVCMTQKRSHRTFLMAMVHMPLRTAVRRPIREKYPLIPCMNITIPNNMRVYSAAQLQLESSKGKNSPSIRRDRAPVDGVPLTARDVELEDVVSLSGEDFLRSHLSLCMDEDSDSDDVERSDDNRLREVQVSNGVGSGGSSTTTLNVPSSGEELDEHNDDDDIPTVITDKEGYSVTSSPIDMKFVENAAVPSTKKKIIPNELLKVSQDAIVVMPTEETVVNMDIPSSAPHTSSASAAGSAIPGNKNVRRKIIPAGLENDFKSSNSHVGEDTMKEKVPQQANIQRSRLSQLQVHGSPVMASPRKKKLDVVPGGTNLPQTEISNVCNSLSHPSSRSSTDSEGLSPRSVKDPQFSPLQDSAFSPASRPETPCWDFYDLGEDLKAQEGLELSSTMLEDSLAQLRQQGIGSLQNLSKEPILPMDLADDFDSLAVDGEQTENVQ